MQDRKERFSKECVLHWGTPFGRGCNRALLSFVSVLLQADLIGQELQRSVSTTQYLESRRVELLHIFTVGLF